MKNGGFLSLALALMTIVCSFIALIIENNSNPNHTMWSLLGILGGFVWLMIAVKSMPNEPKKKVAATSATTVPDPLSQLDPSTLKKIQVKLLNKRYEEVKPIKTGGMAEIVLVRDTKSGNLCIMKKPRPDPDPDSYNIFVNKLSMEDAYLRQFSHPSIVNFIDFFTMDGTPYLIEEYVNGHDLLDSFKSNPAPEGKVLKYAREILDAVAYIHGQKMVHRDINPGNIMLRQDDKIVIIDFGTLKVSGLPGSVISKPGFEIPELVARGFADERSDIYGIGATLFYMLTGIPPGFSYTANLQDFLVNKGITRRTSACVQQALNLEPAYRFNSVGNMKAALLS